MFLFSLKLQNVLYNKIQGYNDDDCENCVFWNVALCNVVEVYCCQGTVLPALSGFQKKKYSLYIVRVKSLGKMGMELLNVCEAYIYIYIYIYMCVCKVKNVIHNFYLNMYECVCVFCCVCVFLYVHVCFVVCVCVCVCV
jgi:hypothetical protein